MIGQLQNSPFDRANLPRHSKPLGLVRRDITVPEETGRQTGKAVDVGDVMVTIQQP